MQKSLFFLFIVSVYFFRCKNSNEVREDIKPIEQIDSTQILASINNDTAQLQKLLENLYEWHETKSSQVDFIPDENTKSDEYLGLDIDKNKKRVDEVRNSNLFSEKFILNYQNIIDEIDASLKGKTIQWIKGEEAPFETGANNWCNCQDSPDLYWKKIKVKKLTIENNIATFKWSFEKGLDYEVKAVKEDGVWKILFLEGLNEENFLNID
jgi:hypothetical protein